MPFGYQLRVKGPLLLLICILVTSLFYLFIGPESARSHSLQTIVSETRSHLAQRLRSVVSNNINTNVYGEYSASSPLIDLKSDSTQTDPENDELQLKYLTPLGFVWNPRLYPQTSSISTVAGGHQNNTSSYTGSALPVFVTAVKSGQALAALNLMREVQEWFPDHQFFVYALTLDEDDLNSLNRSCNTSCSLMKFEFDAYPSHVSDLKLSAYRPLIIQSVLDKMGAVIWLEPDLQIIPSALEKVKVAFEESKSRGFYSWTIDQPTSSMTHPRMFEFFGVHPEDFYFHRMVDGNCLIIFNTEKVHLKIMEPWIRCSLTAYCISPIGAQSSGCRFDKKPLYRYSGCHSYDLSALNVILGIVNDFNEKSYAAEDSERFFRKYTPLDEENVSSSGLEEMTSKHSNDSTPTAKLSFHKMGWRIQA